MKLYEISKFLLILFILLTGTSMIGVYSAYQLPTFEIKTTALCAYEHKGTYNYVAELKPNIIYNRTTLMPGEGRLYRAIVDEINLTFAYVLECNPPLEKNTIDHEAIIQLESPEKWTKMFSDDEAEGLLELSSSLNFTLRINCTKIEEIIDRIDKETGTYSQVYNIKIRPEIHLVGKVETKIIDDTFAPELTVAFKNAPASYIEIENLNQTKKGNITETHQSSLIWVENQRTTFHMTTIITSLALVLSAFIYIEHKPPTSSRKKIQKTMAPHKDLIAETTWSPAERETTIELKTLEDLAKTAEILARPILHATNGKTHTFYTIENDTRYQFETTEFEEKTEVPSAEAVGLRALSLRRLLLNLAGLFLTVSGLLVLAWVSWLIWYDMTLWGKDIALIFFGPRTGQAIGLGIGMKVVYYFLIGIALLLSGLLTLLRRRIKFTRSGIFR